MDVTKIKRPLLTEKGKPQKNLIRLKRGTLSEGVNWLRHYE